MTSFAGRSWTSRSLSNSVLDIFFNALVDKLLLALYKQIDTGRKFSVPVYTINNIKNL